MEKWIDVLAWKKGNGEVKRMWQSNMQGTCRERKVLGITPWQLRGCCCHSLTWRTTKEESSVGRHGEWAGIASFYYELAMRPPACYFLLFGLFSYHHNAMFVLDLE